MADLSDDDIELLKESHSTLSKDNSLTLSETEPAIPCITHLDDSLNQAPLHALQTAFTSLQKKLSTSERQNNELKQRYKIMQRVLMERSEDQRKFGTMDDLYAGEASVAAGAGASNDEEALMAENRARQGYISHLEKELLRGNNTIARSNDEISRLKKRLDEVEKDFRINLQEKDRLLSDRETLIETVNSLRKQLDQKEEDVLKMREKWKNQDTQTANQIKSLTDKLELYERAGMNTNKDTEIQDLKSRLVIADNEMKRAIVQYKESENALKEKTKEVLQLEAKCRQYQIELDIKKNQKSLDDTDEVDGDVGMLSKALEIIQVQKVKLDDMKIKMQEQHQLIQTITSEEKPQGYSMTEVREDATGASIKDTFEEAPCRGPLYGNMLTVSHSSPITRRRSDRSEYRGSNQGYTSPRINDSLKSTGNTNIASMVAAEMPAKKGFAQNVLDSKKHIGQTSPRLSRQNDPMNPSPSLRRWNDSGEYYNTSPRTRADGPSPTLDQTSQVQTRNDLDNSGARPRVSPGYAYLNLQCNEQQEERQSAFNKIPNRMTQSEIHIRETYDRSEVSSPFDQSQTLLMPVRNLPNKNTRENIYENNMQSEIGPDYENIFNASDKSTQRRPSEHEENVFKNNLTGGISQNYFQPSNVLNRSAGELDTRQNAPDHEVEPESVSSVKICPACQQEFSRLTMDQFQMHVYECFDNGEDNLTTLQPAGEVVNDDRVCPMCQESFPASVPQETYEQHVLAHFGEDPMMDRFEMVP